MPQNFKELKPMLVQVNIKAPVEKGKLKGKSKRKTHLYLKSLRNIESDISFYNTVLPDDYYKQVKKQEWTWSKPRIGFTCILVLALIAAFLCFTLPFLF